MMGKALPGMEFRFHFGLRLYAWACAQRQALAAQGAEFSSCFIDWT
jgi:hypothetical protein